MARYIPTEQELLILNYWKEHKVTQKLRKNNKFGKKFYFLQGPPYTSGQIHLGHAWNMGLKDMVLRFKRMQGYDVFDRAGYDMHGLPTEQKAMKKVGLKDKQDIQAFGVKKFMQECHLFCTEMMAKMNEDFERLGATLDFTDPYQPIKNSFMEAEWFLIKQAHEKGRLYQGLRTMHWDVGTQTAVAKHELEYKQITDTSIYVKFPSKDNPKKFFLIWTTTPWTIPLNLGIMVNPELEYVTVQVDDEEWVMAKELHETVMQKANKENFTIKETYLGEKLKGQSYTHPLKIKQYLPQELQENQNIFTILVSKEHVTAQSGTGLVHMAPGCGPEDYEVGHQNGVPPFNCVNEDGLFTDFGPFTDWRAKEDDKKFIEALEHHLVAKEPYTHDYPHGERSHQPVIFRTTKQWFFKMEDLKEELLKANEEINWLPQAGKNAFRSWLQNLRDNSITKQRYWGTPVPIWVHEESGDYIVVGSIKELEELSGKKVDGTLHIPDIDDYTIEKDGKVYKRIPDVLDVWIDAGTSAWNALDYPSNKELFDRYFPADFILEGKDQIRGWFNLLLVAGKLTLNKTPFLNVFMHGFVTDVNGVKMSKSIGNVISPYELIEKHGADVLRYYMSQTAAGEDINFSWDECVVAQRNLAILWNVSQLLIQMAKEQDCNPFVLCDVEEDYDIEERYIISRLHSTIEKVTDYLNAYRLNEAIAPLQDLYLDLSRTYIQMVRDKSNFGEVPEQRAVLHTIASVLLETIKMLSVIAPFITEAIYLNFKEAFDLEEISVSHYAWPKEDRSKINKELEENIALMQKVTQAGLNAREKAKVGLRWPVEEVLVETTDEHVIAAVEMTRDLLKKQLNARSVSIVPSVPNVKTTIKADYKKIGPAFAEKSAQLITHLTVTSAQTLVESFKKQGFYTHTIDGQDCKVTPDMIIFEKHVPEEWSYASAHDISVYVATKRTPALDAEGYAREIMRHMQVLRKKAGLEKLDDIVLFIKVEQGMRDYLQPYSDLIKQRVGAKKLEISLVDPVKKLEYHHTVKVKGHEFLVWFSLA